MSLSSLFSDPAQRFSRSGEQVSPDWQRIVADICQGLELDLDQERFLADVGASVSGNLSETEIWQALILVARARIEMEPAYTFVAARGLLLSLYHEVLVPEAFVGVNEAEALSRSAFPDYIKRGVEAGLLDERLLLFDLASLARALRPERDLLFAYPGLQTLADRYLLQYEK